MPNSLRLPSARQLLACLAGLAFTAFPGRAATYIWNVANPGANHWNVDANWLPGTGNPGSADTAVFGAVGTSPDALTINNVVSVSTALTSLSYTNTGASGVWHVTQIPAGVTLTVNGATALGNLPASLVTTVAFADTGTLVLNGNLTVGNSGASAATSTADFSALSNLVINAASGTVALGSGNRSFAHWKLAAASNSITAATLNDNTGSTSSSGTANTTLGAGTNLFNVGSFNVGFGRSRTTIAFPAGSMGAGLRIRGTAGTDASLCNLTLGNHNTGGSGSTAEGTLSFDGYPVDLRFGTLSLGLSSSGPTGNSPGNGTLSFDTGTVFASNIVMAVSSGTTTFAQANGTINVGYNASLTVGAGGISMASQSAASGAANGTLTVNAGTLICSNSITKATAAGSATLTMNGGSFTMTSGSIGTAAIPLDALNLYGSAVTLAVNSGITNAFVTALSAAGSTIHISSLPTILSYPAQFTLMQFGSGYSDSVLGSLPPGYAGSIVNNANSVDLLITSGPITVRPLTWNGTPSGDWNTTTANWRYLVSPTAYGQGDFVTFDDSASGTTSVNLTTGLAPGSLLVSNATRNYSFSGTGSLVGAGLAKDGAAQLTIGNTGVNTFTNGVNILAGTVMLSGSADRLPTNSIVTLADVAGASLNLNNLSQTLQSLNGGGSLGGDVALGNGTLTVWGGGTLGGVISGGGQLIKTNFAIGGALTLSNANTYAGGTIVGGFTNNTTLAVANPTGSGTGSGFVRVLTNGTFSLGAGGVGGSSSWGAITNDGIVRVNRSDEVNLTNVVVGAGAFQVQGGGTVIINGANGFSGGTTVNPGTLRISNPNALGPGTINVANSNPGVLQLSNNITVVNPLIVSSKPGAAGSVPNIENISGTNTLTGPITMNANGAVGWGFYATEGRLIVAGSTIPVLPSQTSQNTTRILVLSGGAVGEWSGTINDTVNSVTNVAVRKEGTGTWILSGANTYSGPTVISNGVLVLNGSLSSASTLTVHAGGTLAGTGIIGRPVTINADGTLAPGNSIGGLTINNTLTLNGTTIMEVSHAATDRVVGLSTINYGGALKVELAGPVSGGDIFKLFSAATYSGAFTSYDLPTLTPPLDWDTANLAVDGTLRVTGGTLTRPPLSVSQNGSQLTFWWGSASFKLQAQTNSLSTGISGNWEDYPGGGYSPVAVPVNAANPAVFFRLISY